MKKYFGSFLFLLLAVALVSAGSSKSTKGEDQAIKDAGKAIEQTGDELQADLHDAELTTAVKAKFATDKVVSATTVHVETENGVVTLTGSVGTRAEADRAVDIARHVSGVREVNNKLVIEPNAKSDLDKAGNAVEKGVKKAVSEVGDAALLTDIKIKYAADDTVSASRIDVDVKKGVVTLNGTVKSQTEADQAIKIARETDGVKDVVSNLVVKTY